MAYALKITWRETGVEDYRRDARGPAILAWVDRADAEAERELLLRAIGTEVSAIDIVPAPRASRLVDVDEESR